MLTMTTAAVENKSADGSHLLIFQRRRIERRGAEAELCRPRAARVEEGLP
jgi:hypothetical protein